MQVRTYSDILDRLEALCGKDTFTSQEQARILSLVNARWFKAYTACEYWPRYSYVGEARYVDPTTGAVSFTQASVVKVSGAGTNDVDGTYQPTGTLNSKTLYYLDGDTNSLALFWTGSIWRIANDVSSTIVYYATAGGTDPWDGTWSAITGVSPVPVVAEGTRAEIDAFTRISTAHPFGGPESYGYDVDFHVTQNGAIPLATPSTPYTQLFVTYRSTWGGPYAANATTVPIEFFEYIAHGVYADWLRSTGQNTPQAESEDATAQQMLNYEMIKSQVQANGQIARQRFSTYISSQSRSWYNSR
jgi:hypothetical protein